jgi:sigma-B regulation protein RsbU (phosphoserine phosphatase)
MMTQLTHMLRQVPFLQGLDRRVIEQLAAAAVERTFAPGEMIMEEGAHGRELYFLLEGEVEVLKGHGDAAMTLARRGPGELFGEMSMIEDVPRFASIRAVTECRMLEFSEVDIEAILAREPDLLFEVVRTLSARLRQTDLHMIADLQRKNEELARAYRELQAAQAALVEKERLEHELELARDLQQSILPKVFPRLPGFSCAARNRPARMVGGDFYDAIPLSADRVGLVIADVSGKGMAAALYMALARSLIRAEAHRSASPRQVLLRFHRLLLEMGHAEMFITVFYGILDPQNRTLCYARAGHDYPLLLRPATGECLRLESPGMLLGYEEDVHLSEMTLELQPGDALVLYSDGITDVRSPADETIGAARLRELVATADRPTAEGLCDRIMDYATAFQGTAGQYDDMTLLIAQVL